MSTQPTTVCNSKFLSISLPLTARGIKVVPVQPLEKRCTLPGWPQLATTDVSQIEQWAKHGIDYNVACVADEKICILDCDTVGLVEQIELETGRRMPETFSVKSAGKGATHLYFKHTERSRKLGNRSGAGLFDFKASDSYVVGPGSKLLCQDHEVREYATTSDAEFAEIPDWLCVWIEAKSDKKKDAPKGGVPVAEDFDIDRFLTHYGLSYRMKDDHWYITDQCPVARRKHSQSTLTGFFYDGERFGFNCFASNCPGSTMTVGEVIEHLNKGDGLKIVTPYGGPIWAKPQMQVTCDLSEDVDYTLSADEFLKEKLPPLEPLLTTDSGATLLYRKSVNQVFSFRGVGKSIFTLAALVKPLTVGGAWLRYRGEGGHKVLLVDGELPGEMIQERLRAQVGNTGGLLRFISPERLPNHTLPSLAEPSGQEWMLGQIRKMKPDVVIFDTLTACFRFDTNDTDRWSAVNQFFIKLRLLGLCVIIVHHAGKNGTQRGRTDGDDNLDLVIKLESPQSWEPGDGAEFVVKYEKVRSGAHLQSFQAKLARGEWVESVDPSEAEVVKLLVEGKSQRAISARTGVSQAKVSRIKNRTAQNPMIELPTA